MGIHIITVLFVERVYIPFGTDCLYKRKIHIVELFHGLFEPTANIATRLHNLSEQRMNNNVRFGWVIVEEEMAR